MPLYDVDIEFLVPVWETAENINAPDEETAKARALDWVEVEFPEANDILVIGVTEHKND